MAKGLLAPYEVAFLANRRVHVGDEPVLLMRLESAMTIAEAALATLLPGVVEL